MWWWVLIWSLVVLGSLAFLGLVGLRLYRKGAVLARELQTASERFEAVGERLDELARAFTPEPSAVFQDPVEVRQRTAGARRR